MFMHDVFFIQKRRLPSLPNVLLFKRQSRCKILSVFYTECFRLADSGMV